MASRCRLRPASLADVAALAELERAAFSDPWTPAQLRHALGWAGAVALVAHDADGLAGYVLGRVVVDEAEILSIATAPSRRRRGIGRTLLVAVTEAMHARGAKAIWLEVRVSNAAAQEMYRTAGFEVTATRRDYYQQPLEDALVLRRDLRAPA